jgi:hypothetical protein
MSKASEFRQYAEDAMRAARLSKSSIEQEALIDVAHMWVHAAIQSETILSAPRTYIEPKDV